VIALLLVIFYRLPRSGFGIYHRALYAAGYVLSGAFRRAGNLSYDGRRSSGAFCHCRIQYMACMMLKREFSSGGIFPVSVKYVYDTLFKALMDASIVIFIAAFVLLCFSDGMLNSLASDLR
jgi:hypothetical protein